MRIFTADEIFCPDGLHGGRALVFEDDGTFREILDTVPENAEELGGILCPGFVNAHCHSELSHLRGRIPPQTGMTGFIRPLMAERGNFSDTERQTGIREGMKEMWENGIQGVGDICNGPESLPAREAVSEMQFHAFVELFGSDPSQAEEILSRGMDLAVEFPAGTASVSPHAPYSMSRNLLEAVYETARIQGNRISIHLLESREERQLFERLDGPFMDMFRDWGIQFQGHVYASPVDFLLDGLPEELPAVLFVHNTEMKRAEFDRIRREVAAAWFVLCPRANAYIHDRLPDLPMFLDATDRVCLGTDSLAGTWSLDLLADLRLIRERWPEIPRETLLSWATRNGAEALGMNDRLGEFRPGLRPGLLQIREAEGNFSALRRLL